MIGSVLVIDDNHIMADLTNEILRSNDFKSIFFTNNNLALEYYRVFNDEIDVILLDFEMPDMSCNMLIDKLLDINKTTKIIIMSGFPIEDIVNKVNPLKYSAFIEKPFKIDALVNLVSACISSK